MANTSTQGARYIVNLQVLRLIAAMLVVIGHAEHEVVMWSAKNGTDIAPLGLFDWGIGVDIFFVISGFIMYYLMHDSFARPNACRDFLWRRIVRIVPLYWTCTTLTLASVLLAGSLMTHNELDWRHLIASYVFMPWPRSDGTVFPLLSLGWSLNYEMFFYLVFSVVLLMPLRLGLSVLALVFAGLIAAAAFFHDQFWALDFFGNTIIGEFGIGIGLAWIYLSGRRVSGLQGALLVTAGAVLAVLMFKVGLYLVVGRVITGGLPALMIAAGVVLSRFASQARVLRWGALGGDASYVLYLTHPFAIRALTGVWQRAGLTYSWFFVIVGVTLAVVASMILHVFIEKPITAWILGITTTHPAPRSSAKPSRRGYGRRCDT